MRPMRKRAALLGGLVLALVAVPSGPVSANPKGGCPLGKLCVYSGRGYTGDRQDLDPRVTPCTTVPTPVWSAVNRTGPWAGTVAYRLRLFRDNACTAQASTVVPEAARADTRGAVAYVLEER